MERVPPSTEPQQVDLPPPRGKPWLAIAAAAIATATGAGASAYFLAPVGVLAGAGAKAEASASGRQAAAASASGKKSHGEANRSRAAEADLSGEGGSQFIVRGGVGVFVPRPIVVTLKPQGRVRYLKVGLAIETSPDAGSVFVDRELRIIDVLNDYLRAVPVSVVEDPAAMSRIREQIARRVRFVVDAAPVDDVLITDFILS